MNNFLKLLQKLNYNAFRAVKRVEYRIGAYIHQKKIDALVAKTDEIQANFNPYDRDDVDCIKVPTISFDEYPTIVDLTRYMRSEFNKTYPRFIDCEKEECSLVLKLINVGDEALELPYCIDINNGYGKYYTYREFVMEKVSNIE